jgi:rare lipoprotein A
MRLVRLSIGLILLLAISACGTPHEKPPYSGQKIGKPYEVMGQHYEPGYDAHYDEIGMASWYGPGFHGGKTANGEKYDQNDMTAAHRTLPLPSIVRVTNLNNGKSILVRVNDRGPFKRNRILDLSKAAATKLDIVRSGSAKVRVQFLDRETREYVQNMQHGNQYAMDSLKEVDPNAAGATEDAMHKTHFETVPTALTSTPPASYQPDQREIVAMNAVHTDPLPPHVTEQPEPRLRTPLDASAKADPDPNMENASNEFSVIDSAYASAVQRPVVRPSTQNSYQQPSAGGFFIQAGTFSQKENANNLLSRISGYGSSLVMEVMANQKKFYRVMMGPYSMQNDAKNMLSKLSAMGIPDARIIHN